MSKRGLSSVAAIVLVSLVLCLLYLLALKLVLSDFCFPLDDAYIHFVFARNTAHGDFFAYNPGTPVAGTTSPLWVLLMVPAYWLGIAPELWAYLWGWLLLALSGVLAYRFAREFMSDRFAIWSGLLVVSSGRLVYGAMSGMEMTLAAFLWLLAAFLVWRLKSNGKGVVWTALILALSVYARPEAYLFTVVCLAYLLIEMDTPGQKRIAVSLKPKPPFLTFLVWFVLVLPYPILCYASHGRPLPTTFYAKRYEGLMDFSEYIASAVAWFIRDNLIWGVAGLAALLLAYFGFRWARESGSKRIPAIVALWLASFLGVEAITAPILWHHARYTIPLIPFWILLGMWFVDVAFKRFDLDRELVIRFGRGATRAIAISTLLLWLTFGLNVERSLKVLNRNYLPDAGAIRDINIAMAEIVKKVVPEGVTVAINDVGAIAYFGNRPVFDLLGLVSPEALPIIDSTGYLGSPTYARKMLDYLKCRPDIQYAAIFPFWFPGMMNPEVFEPLYDVVGMDGGEYRRPKMKILYRLHTEKLGPCEPRDY